MKKFYAIFDANHTFMVGFKSKKEAEFFQKFHITPISIEEKDIWSKDGKGGKNVYVIIVFRRECEPYMYQAYADKQVAKEVLSNLRGDRMSDYWMQKVVFMD